MDEHINVNEQAVCCGTKLKKVKYERYVPVHSQRTLQ